MRDYLGSVRTILDITQDGTAVTDASAVILEQNDYLPFGTRVSLSAQAYDPPTATASTAKRSRSLEA